MMQIHAGTLSLKYHILAVIAWLFFSGIGQALAEEGAVVWHDNEMVVDGHIAKDGIRAYSHDGFTLKIWKTDSAQVLRSIRITSLFNEQWPMIGGVSASPTLDAVAIATKGRIDLFDLNSSQRRWSVETGIDAKKIVWSDNGRFLVAAADYSKSALVLNAITGNLVSHLDFSKLPDGDDKSVGAGSLESIAISANGETVFLGGWNEGGLYSSITGEPLIRLRREGIFFGAAFSTSGDQLTTALSNNEACLWDAKTGELFRCMVGHQNLVTDVIFSADGKRLASGGYGGTVRLWDTASGEPIGILEGHKGGVYGLSFSPNGHTLLSVGGDSTARLWLLTDGKQIEESEKAGIIDAAPTPQLVAQLGHAGGVTASALSSDGVLLVTAGDDGTVIVTDTMSGRVVRRITAHPGGLGKINAVFLAFDEQSVITASDDGTVGVWETSTGIQQLQINVSGQVDALELLDDGARIITASDSGGYITVWDGHTGEKVKRIGQHYDRAEGVNAMALFGDKKRLVTARRDGTVRIFDIETETEPQVINVSSEDMVYDVGVTPDGSRLVTANLKGKVAVWDIGSGQNLHSWELGDAQVWSLDIDPGGKYVVLGTNGGEAHIYDLGSGARLRTLAKLKNPQGWSLGIHTVSFSSDGSRFVIGAGGTGEEPGIAQLWPIDGGPLINEYSGQVAPVLSAKFSSDGMFVTATGAKETALWDLSTGNITARLQHKLHDSARFTANSEHLVIPQSDNVTIRSLRDGRQVPLIKKEENSFSFIMISHVMVSPDGRFVLTDELDGLMLRELDSGRVLHKFPAVGLGGASPVFTKKGDAFLTVTHDSVTLWDVESGSARVRIDQAGAFLSFNEAIFTADNHYALLRDSGRDHVLLLDLQLGKIARRFPAEDSGFSSSSNSYWLLRDKSGEAVLLNATYDGSYRLLDPVSGEEKLRLSTGTGYITAAQLSADGRRLATAGEDRVVSVWDRETGELLTRLTHHSDSINSIQFSANRKRLLTASSDGSVGLWNLASGNLLASLLGFNNDDWAVVAPDGRYDSNSPGDLPALSWVMPDDPLKPLPVEIFIREYFEPRLLVRLLGGEVMPPVQIMTEVNRLQPVSEIVSIVSSPGDPSAVDVTVKVTNVEGPTGHSGVRDLRLFRNGQLVSYALETTESHDLSTKIEFKGIRLPTNHAGESIQFEAYAFNDNGVKGVTAHHNYIIPEYISVRQPRAYVISIGVNSHETPAWDLLYSAADARAVQQVLVDSMKELGRYEKVVQLSLISDAKRGEFLARKEVISAALRLLAGKQIDSELRIKYPELGSLMKAAPEDTVIITFSGHGYADEDGVFYLFPEDIGERTSRSVDAATLSRTISGNELNDWLRDVDAGEMIMIIDACNSSASVEGGGFKPGPMGSKGFGQLAYDKGMRILTATQAENVALESDLIGHGIMTYALVREGLENTLADRQPVDGEILVGELLAYVVERVPQLYQEVKRGKVLGSRGLVRVHKPNTTDRESRNLNVQRPGLFDFIKTRNDLVIKRHAVPLVAE